MHKKGRDNFAASIRFYFFKVNELPDQVYFLNHNTIAGVHSYQVNPLSLICNIHRSKVFIYRFGSNHLTHGIYNLNFVKGYTVQGFDVDYTGSRIWEHIDFSIQNIFGIQPIKDIFSLG